MAESRLCPRYHQAVELVGRRWAGAIISILLRSPARYNEIRAEIPDISDRMLAERLKELEAEGSGRADSHSRAAGGRRIQID